MVPMTPIPYAIVSFRRSPAQRISGSAPLADSLLPRQHETRRARTAERAEIGGEILAPTVLGIGDALDSFVEFRRPERFIAMMPVQAWNSSATCCRCGSCALTRSTRSTGSWQPSVSNGSRTHSHQVSKLPKGRPRFSWLGTAR
jgi:hypothetical protein